MKKLSFSSLILFENDDYLLVNKPPLLSSLEDRAEPWNLQRLAIEYCPESQLAHRLDKETSGVLAVAKNPEAYRSLTIQFEQREVKKIYHALVKGIYDFKDEVIDLPIKKLSVGAVKIDKREGKAASTIISTILTYRGYTLLECKPVSGRMHQIRIHLSATGMPIISDHLYHGDDIYLSSLKPKYNLKKWTEELPLIKRVALHATKLEFKGLSGEQIDAEAPYPKDFEVLIKQLDKYS
ncbi:MAG: RNA pseudouridine synthase [Bacteroidota bacterium]